MSFIVEYNPKAMLDSVIPNQYGRRLYDPYDLYLSVYLSMCVCVCEQNNSKSY